MTKSDPKAWFAFDGEHFDGFTSPEEAKKAAESALSDYRSEAGEGWNEDAYNVCWGRIMEVATVIVERPRQPSDCVDADIDTIQEIELRGIHPLWLQCPCAESMQRWS